MIVISIFWLYCEFFSQLVHGHDLNVLLAKGFARLDVNHDQIFEKEEMEAVIKKDDDNGKCCCYHYT